MRILLLSVAVLACLLAASPTLANDAEPAAQAPTRTRLLVAPPGTEHLRPRWRAHVSPEQHYRRGRLEKQLGIGLTTTGGVLLLSGVGLLVAAVDAIGRPCMDWCYAPFMYGFFAGASGLASAPFLIAGIPLWRHGHRRMVHARPYLEIDPGHRLPRRRATVGIRARF